MGKKNNNSLPSTSILFFNPHPNIFFPFIVFQTEWKGGKRGEREKYLYQRDTIGCLLHKPYPRLGIELAIVICL